MPNAKLRYRRRAEFSRTAFEEIRSRSVTWAVLTELARIYPNIPRIGSNGLERLGKEKV